jgi:hypothetical protein
MLFLLFGGLREWGCLWRLGIQGITRYWEFPTPSKEMNNFSKEGALKHGRKSSFKKTRPSCQCSIPEKTL